MQYRKLGRTGLDVSIIGLGMEHLTSRATLQPVVHHAIEAGINYIDPMIWRAAVKDAFAAAVRGRREGLILAGHLGVAETRGQYRRTRDLAECEALWSDWLTRLGTECIDVLHITYLDLPEDLRQVMQPGGVLELARRLQREGKAPVCTAATACPARSRSTSQASSVCCRARSPGASTVSYAPITIP